MPSNLLGSLPIVQTLWYSSSPGVRGNTSLDQSGSKRTLFFFGILGKSKPPLKKTYLGPHLSSKLVKKHREFVVGDIASKSDRTRHLKPPPEGLQY